jgi:hypothetical protein
MWNNLLFIFLTLFADASQIDKVNGKKVFIMMSEETFKVGDKVYALGEDGKRKALLTITKVRGEKAQADVIKGKVKPGMSVTSGGGGGDKSSSKSKVSSERSSGRKMGVIGGISQNSMTISTGGSSANYNGSSFALSGMLDIPISQVFTIRGKAGLNQFSVAQGSIGASFSYIGFEGGINWNINKSFWLGGGGAFLLTVSKSSNIPSLASSAATNSFFFLGAGSNISIGRNNYIPLSIDYALYPGGGVTANSLILRAGYAWNY